LQRIPEQHRYGCAILVRSGDAAFRALVAAASLGYDPREVLAQVAVKVRGRLTGSKPPIPTPPRTAAGGSIPKTYTPVLQSNAWRNQWRAS
jgi:hypothetical protein